MRIKKKFYFYIIPENEIQDFTTEFYFPVQKDGNWLLEKKVAGQFSDELRSRLEQMQQIEIEG